MSQPLSATPTSSNNSLTAMQHSVSERLRILSEKSGYKIVQENGQRKYGPPPEWEGGEPPRGCEVFIGKLDRSMMEDEIIPIFEKIGKLYQFRLMMDFSGTNRGYAFAKYTNKNDAKKAVAQLNSYEIRPGCRLGVLPSVENCRLYLGNIPRTKTQEEVRQEICKLTDGVVKVILYPNVEDRTKNRGFAFVEYLSHQAATAARRKLIPGQLTMWNVDIEVDWAEPEQEPDDEVIAQVKNLYVRNLAPSTNESKLKQYFESITQEGAVERVKKLKDYAFVHFKQKDDATLALKKADGVELEGSVVEVVWAKPVDWNLKRLKTMQLQQNQPTRQSLQQVPASATFLSSNPLAQAPNFSYLAGPHFFLSNSPHSQLNGLSAGTVISIPKLYNGTPVLTSSNLNSAPLLNTSFAHLAGSHSAVAYAGQPFIDTSNGSTAQNNQWLRSMNNRSRSAAGMRSASFQSVVQNGSTNRLRKKFVENVTLNENVNDHVTANGMTGSSLLLFPQVQHLAAIAAMPLTAVPPLLNSAAQLVPPTATIFAHPQTTIDDQNTVANNGEIQSPPGSSDVVNSVNVQHPTPQLSSAFSGKGYCEILDNYCDMQKLGKAQYELTPMTAKDSAGNDVLMYVCSVVVPSLMEKYGRFEHRDKSLTENEAKEKAAQYVLLSLGYNFNQPSEQAPFLQQSFITNQPLNLGAPCRVGSVSVPPPPPGVQLSRNFPSTSSYQSQVPSSNVVQQPHAFCLQ